MKTRKSKKKIITGKPTPELFQMMVEDHDPTYLWSKNDAHIKAEKIKEKEILKIKTLLGDQITVPIWNQIIRKKVVPSFVSEYLWNIQPSQ